MRKLFIITALVLFAGVAFGQTIQKGSVIGLHTTTITLNSGVTLDQYMDFVNDKLIPEFEKEFPGLKLYIIKGLNREIKDQYGLIFFAESKKAYNTYWNDDGSDTDKTVAAAENVQSLMEEWNKLATSTSVITDWVIQ
jgi:hypothetical protein